MRKDGAVYRCSLCEAILEIPEGAKVRTMVEGCSDDPHERVIYAQGDEIHRCAVAPY
jgi:hypothetical protein